MTVERIFSDDLAVQARRERVAAMYLQGLTQYEIAEREKINQGNVSRDLQAVRKAWQSSAIRDYDEDVNRELDRIDLLERTYWDAWQRSLSERTRSRTKRRTGAQPSDEASVEREQRDGNPAYLAGVLSCIEKRCKILGLDAPERHRHEHEHTLTVEQRRDRLAAYLASFRVGGAGGGNGSLPGTADAN